MKDVTLILAAHGAGDGSPTNGYVRRLAESLRGPDAFASVICAFRKGTPTFADALDSVRTRRVLVLPIMTSEGYFSTRVLPNSLAASLRYEELDVTIAPPLGVHPAMIDMTEEIIRDAAERTGIDPADAAILIVGHGTRRHAASRSRTVEVADILGQRNSDWRMLTAFLDEPPYLAGVEFASTDRAVIAVPFLIGGGHHATIDIPRHLGIDGGDCGAAAPHVGRIDHQLRVCTQPVGMHPGIAGIIRDIARSTPENTHAGAA